MTFDVAPEVYDAYMGRFSAPLARLFAEWADLPDSGEILDVGSGPGALTAVLVERYDAASVTAIDPSATFVAAIEQRLPGVEARLGAAEALPFPDDSFDASLAALVVHYALFYTRWGLRTRAVGEHPHAADTAGIDVIRMRLLNVTLAGSLAGAPRGGRRRDDRRADRRHPQLGLYRAAG